MTALCRPLADHIRFLQINALAFWIGLKAWRWELKREGMLHQLERLC